MFTHVVVAANDQTTVFTQAGTFPASQVSFGKPLTAATLHTHTTTSDLEATQYKRPGGNAVQATWRQRST
jgi:hypothetical protein